MNTNPDLERPSLPSLHLSKQAMKYTQTLITVIMALVSISTCKKSTQLTMKFKLRYHGIRGIPFEMFES